MNIALIGRGRWGQNIERTLGEFPDVSVAVVGRGDAVPENSDAVVVVTPSTTHADVALPWIERGIPTFIEKPLATKEEDARRIEAAAKRSGAFVFVGHIQLHNPAFIAACDAVPRIGAIRFLASDAMNDRPRADSSVLWDWLPHELSMAHALTDQLPHAAQAISLREHEGLCAAAHVRFQFDGLSLLSRISSVSEVKRRSMTVVGQSGRIIFDDVAATKTLVQVGSTAEHPAYDPEPPLKRELEAFIRAVKSGSGDTTSLALGRRIVSCIAAAEQSAREDGREIFIEH